MIKVGDVVCRIAHEPKGHNHIPVGSTGVAITSAKTGWLTIGVRFFFEPEKVRYVSIRSLELVK